MIEPTIRETEKMRRFQFEVGDFKVDLHINKAKDRVGVYVTEDGEKAVYMPLGTTAEVEHLLAQVSRFLYGGDDRHPVL